MEEEVRKEVCRLFDDAIRDENEAIEFYKKILGFVDEKRKGAEETRDLDIIFNMIDDIKSDEECHILRLEGLKMKFCEVV
jgi:catechol 2,3-dioxygenase-like lactoylglutathione lyase family enzyme